jgi:hypothetical protein
MKVSPWFGLCTLVQRQASLTQKAWKIEFILDNFALQFRIRIDSFLTHPFRMSCCENSSLKALILVNHLHCFNSKLNRFCTPFADGLCENNSLKVLILANHFHFTTCGWATFD